MADFLEADECDGSDHHFGHQEWDRLEENFVNAGYREGITAGKEEALQEGFDAGFARFGAPIGRDIGSLRGLASALFVLLNSEFDVSSNEPTDVATEVAKAGPDKVVDGVAERTRVVIRDDVGTIIKALAKQRFASLMPPDKEAIAHAREHGASAEDLVGEGGTTESEWKEKSKEVEALRARLENVTKELGLDLKL